MLAVMMVLDVLFLLRIDEHASRDQVLEADEEERLIASGVSPLAVV
jgi:hypothetical protein